MDAKKKKYRIALIENDLTQVALARKLGVTDCYVSMLIRGVRHNEKLQRKIASIVGLDYAELWREAA